MSGLALFAKTRRWRTCAAIIAASAALVIACGPVAISLDPGGDAPVRVAMMVPLIPALAIAATLVSPLPDQEHGSARRLEPFDTLHVALTSAATLAALGLAGAFLPSEAQHDPQGVVSLIRNFLALSGLAVIAYRVLGPKIGWLPAVLWVLVPPVLMPRPSDDPVGLLTLVTQPDPAAGPAALSAVLWLGGLLLAGQLSIARRLVHSTQA